MGIYPLLLPVVAVPACSTAIGRLCWRKFRTETRLEAPALPLPRRHTQNYAIRPPGTTTRHIHTRACACVLQAGRDTPIKVWLLPTVASRILMLILSSFELYLKHQICFSPVLLLKICSSLPTSDTPSCDGPSLSFKWWQNKAPYLQSALAGTLILIYGS